MSTRCYGQLSWLFSHHFALVLLQMESLAFWGRGFILYRKWKYRDFFFPSCSRFSKSAAAFTALNTELTIQFIPKGK